MKKKTYSSFEIKRKIKQYRKRLENLKRQGFYFSSEIYDELAQLDTKIKNQTIPYKIWNDKKLRYASIIVSFCLILIAIYIIIPPEIEIEVESPIPNEIYENDFTFLGNAKITKGEIHNVRLSIQDNFRKDIKFNRDENSIEWDENVDISTCFPGRCYIVVNVSNDENVYKLEEIPIFIDNDALYYVDFTDFPENWSTNKSCFINGTFSSINRNVTNISLFINDTKIENITTEKSDNMIYWSFFLNISDFDDLKYYNNFNHSFQIMGHNDYDDTMINSTVLRIIKETPDPRFSFLNPTNNSEVDEGIFQIVGNIDRGINFIENIEISFNQGDWTEAIGIDPWYLTIDSTGLRDRCQIRVRALFKNGIYSKSTGIFVNIKEEEITGVIIEFPENLNMTFYPDEVIELKIKHAKNLQGILNKERDHISHIEITEVPEYLIVNLENSTIYTPNDGTWHYSTYTVQIQNDSPKTKVDRFQIIVTTYPDFSDIKFVGIRRILERIYDDSLTDDIWFNTGLW